MRLKYMFLVLAATVLMGCDASGDRFVIEVLDTEYKINGISTNALALRERLASVENPEGSDVVFLVPSYEQDSILLIQGMEMASELGYGNVSIATPQILQEVEEFKNRGGT